MRVGSVKGQRIVEPAPWYNIYMTLPQLPLYVDALMETFRKAGYSIYVVGGPVRDMLLGKPPIDLDNWDFATSANPSQMLELLPTAKYENDFGTVLIPLLSPSGSFVLAEITPLDVYKRQDCGSA